MIHNEDNPARSEFPLKHKANHSSPGTLPVYRCSPRHKQPPGPGCVWLRYPHQSHLFPWQMGSLVAGAFIGSKGDFPSKTPHCGGAWSAFGWSIRRRPFCGWLAWDVGMGEIGPNIISDILQLPRVVPFLKCLQLQIGSKLLFHSLRLPGVSSIMYAQRLGWSLAAALSLLVTSSHSQTIEVDGKTVGTSNHVAAARCFFLGITTVTQCVWVEMMNERYHHISLFSVDFEIKRIYHG